MCAIYDAHPPHSHEQVLRDAGSEVSFSPAEVRAWELMLRRIVGPPPAKVLDACTGTGAVALLLASLGYDVTAVDAAPRMVGVARAKAERAGLGVRVQEALAADLPFEDGLFDAVTCRLAFGLLLEPEACAREWRRASAQAATCSSSITSTASGLSATRG